ncbi:MAG: hypothetical protein ABI337_06705 [Nitrososphaera sp.]|jgi:hypothetical protein
MQVIKVTGRGTGRRKTEVGAQNWAGDSYRKVQQERLAKIERNLTLVLGRGEKTLNIKDLPPPRPKPHIESLVCVTNRGTSARKCSY